MTQSMNSIHAAALIENEVRITSDSIRAEVLSMDHDDVVAIFSDWYKDMNNIRPRFDFSRWSVRDMVEHMETPNSDAETVIAAMNAGAPSVEVARRWMGIEG